MKYTFIAAALVGAAFAMPAAPASYGEAPAAYGSDSENVYGTQVSNQQTTSAALPSSTCTDEAENAVPYTSAVAQSQVVESSAPAYGVPSVSSVSNVPAMQTSASEASLEKPAETQPAGYATKPADVASTGASSAMMSSETMPAEKASSTEVSPEMPAETQPAGYASQSMASSSMSSPVMPESSAPATGAMTESSPKMPAEYGSTVVPGSAPTAAPYPVGGASSVAQAGMATGTAGAAMPTGTGSVGGYEAFEGAASSLTVGGFLVSFGAIAALFM